MKKKVLRMIHAKSRCGVCVSRAVSSQEQLQVEEITNRLYEYGEKLAKDPIAAKAMLFGTGMYDRDGNLKEEFK